MEELRSTEVLDREILEDARKKAFRILKTTDETLVTQKQDWEKKTREAVDSIRKVYAERTKITGAEIFARLPLDKRRLRSEAAERLLVEAMDNYLRTLPREKLLSILERELSERLEASVNEGEEITGDGAKPEFLCSGLSLSEARGVLEKVLVVLEKKSGGHLTSHAEDYILKEDSSALARPAAGSAAREFPSLVINTPAMKITASVKIAAGTLLKDKRAELAAALLGEGVLND